MRRLLTWLLVTLGIAALVRKLRRRRVPSESATAEPVPVEPGSDPADELRRKLAETRTEPAETTPAPEASVEERRAEVHEQASAALDEMQKQSEET